MSRDKNWNTAHAKNHYCMDQWGLGLFDINSAGHVSVKASSAEIDLYELSQQLKAAGISLPVLLRFPHLLQHMLSFLNAAFRQAISDNHYQGDYIAAYPIKVNQQAAIIQHFHQQTQWPIAFEVGSKAELIACLGIKQNQTIICNGYKDETYIRLALMGTLLGHEIIIVLESLLEFQYVLKLSSELNVTPVLGMRIRLTSIADGNWQNTGGTRSKFGFTSNEALQLIAELKQHNIGAWMQMLHFHMGSQIPSLQHIRDGVNEGMRYYCELISLGVQLTKLNVGGGLGVDYEGSHSKSYFSTNYTIQDYANTIIEVVSTICKQKNLASPTIYSENGRAMAAYHAVLLTNVINVEYQQVKLFDEVEKLYADEDFKHPLLKSLFDLNNKIALETQRDEQTQDAVNHYNQLNHIMQIIEEKFSEGEVSLSDKARAEMIYKMTCQRLLKYKKILSSDVVNTLEKIFVDKYFCNFSVFQSTPDVWGLNQIFPVLPLHRLNDFPERNVRLHDLTCDSDGQIDRYIENGAINTYISLHGLQANEDYILGLFLVGAYQEILGDMHNLFGDTNAVNIELNSDGGYHICEEEPGDTVEEVLSYVHIDTIKMRQTWLDKLEKMKVSEKVKSLMLQQLESSLQSDTYLTHIPN